MKNEILEHWTFGPGVFLPVVVSYGRKYTNDTFWEVKLLDPIKRKLLGTAKVVTEDEVSIIGNAHCRAWLEGMYE
jgi:hypothetical protein